VSRVHRRLWPVFGITLATAMVLVMFGPILTVLIWAFAEVWRYPNLLPTQWGLRFWHQVFSRESVLTALSTSVTIAFVSTTLCALVCWPAAYAFARLRFPGRQAIFLSFLAAQAFPKFAIIVAVAVIFLRLGLVGTLTGVILAQVMNGLLYMIWIPTAAFRAVPPQLEEAAFDLGGSRLRVFLEVTLPQTLPSLVAAYIFAFVAILFEFEIGMLIGAPHVTTMPVLMLQLAAQVTAQQAAVLCVVIWVPCFILLVLSRRLMSADRIAQGLGA
jgi:putative spermidine/putrescine transport system permease protein